MQFGVVLLQLTFVKHSWWTFYLPVWDGTKRRSPRQVHNLRGRTATQRSKKCYEKVLGKDLGKGSQKGACYGFCSQ